MDEYANEVEEEIVEEEFDEGEVVDEVEEEQTEQQRAEAADVVKLFKQHPEIWIPYEEQVQERLVIRPPGAPGESAPMSAVDMVTSLRDISLLDANHTTYPFLTNYEKTKCISFRASQINNGAKPYILVPTGVNDSYQIAKMELEERRLPFIVKRPMPDGTYEVWRLNDLLIL